MNRQAQRNSDEKEMSLLLAKQEYLSQLCSWAKQNLRYTVMEKSKRTLVYVTRDDLLRCYGNSSILAVKGHEKAERLPVMVDKTIIMGRGLHISAKDQPIDVLMATTAGQSLIETSAIDDYKIDGGAGGVGGKRKSSLNAMNTSYVNPQAVPEHFEVNRELKDKNGILRRFQEYKKTANLLLNYRSKNPIRDRRLRLRNYYQGRRDFEGFVEAIRNEGA